MVESRSPAFWAAYDSLQRRGVDLAHVREDVADRIMAVIGNHPRHALTELYGAECAENRRALAADIRSATTSRLPRKDVIASAIGAAVSAILDGDE